MKENKTAVIKSYVTETYHNYLEEVCKERNTSLSGLVRNALYEYLKEMK